MLWRPNPGILMGLACTEVSGGLASIPVQTVWIGNPFNSSTKKSLRHE